MAATNYLLWVFRRDGPDEGALIRPGWAAVTVGRGDGVHPGIRLDAPEASHHFLSVFVDGDVVRLREYPRGGVYLVNGHPIQPDTYLRPGDRIEIGSEALRLEAAPAIDPAWLAWGDGAVLALAQAIYRDNDAGRLPLLADALEDAGCADPLLLGHLRSPSHPHNALACWAVDLVLGEEMVSGGRR
jgi:hypothetical protein